MDYNLLISESKWKLLEELSKKEQTPTELAEKFKTTIANISQQLKLLEAYNVVKKEREQGMNNPGKPKTIYSINRNINYIISLSDNLAIKKELHLDPFHKGILKTCLLANCDNAYYLEKFLITNEELINKCDMIGIVKTNDEQIELILITKHVESIREKYSNQTLNNYRDHKKKIICWTHNLNEIEEGIKSSNDYFLQLVNNYQAIIDKQDTVRKIKEMQNEQSN